MDNDIVQGEEDQGIQEEEGGGETSWMINVLIKWLGNIDRLRVICISEHVQRRFVFHVSFVAAAVVFFLILSNSVHWEPELPKILCFLVTF